MPEERSRRSSGGETVEGFHVEYTPGHASHHVCYLHEESGDATWATSPACASRPTSSVVAPTPPPDIDVEAWLDSIHTVAALEPAALCLTHFGQVTDVDRAPAPRSATR